MFFADDIVLVAESEEDMYQMMSVFLGQIEAKKLEINVNKSLIMRMSRGKQKGELRTEWELFG